MDSKEADRQIEQMIAFIRQEAKEKAEEIRQKTNEDKTIEKLSYKVKESKIIRQEFEVLRKEKLTQKKIHRSTKINEARFTVMQKREDLLAVLKDDILLSLCEVSKNNQYATFIRFLIVEGLTVIMEETVEVVCRKEDAKIVEGELTRARDTYIKIVKRDTGVTPRITLRMNTKNKFLPPHPTEENKGASCRGGVILEALHGRIKCNATVESRLKMAFKDQLPVMRGMLFGIRGPPENAYVESKRKES